ncbi:MAG TPA: hypothetical protein VNB22_09130, partial [Pyrinomonadaceae bacterium]|nr:hypothetical protein [Pyrinomonadaceae bacterium]
MRKFALTFLLTFSFILTANAQEGVVVKLKKDYWISYVAKKAGFKVEFPEKPFYIDVDTSTPPVKRTNHMYTSLANPIVYMVVYSDNPVLPLREKEDLNADYDFLKSNLKNVKSEIISEKDIVSGNYKGREITSKAKDIIVIDRLFLINKKLYQVLVSIDEKDLKNEIKLKLVQRYFDSFTV